MRVDNGRVPDLLELSAAHGDVGGTALQPEQKKKKQPNTMDVTTFLESTFLENKNLAYKMFGDAYPPRSMWGHELDLLNKNKQIK